MEYELLARLAERGFRFAPTSMGISRSDLTGWPFLSTPSGESLNVVDRESK